MIFLPLDAEQRHIRLISRALSLLPMELKVIIFRAKKKKMQENKKKMANEKRIRALHGKVHWIVTCWYLTVSPKP